MTDYRKALCEVPEEFLDDVIEYADRCSEKVGEAHLLLQDKYGSYYVRHIGQVRNPEHELLYFSNPYKLN